MPLSYARDDQRRLITVTALPSPHPPPLTEILEVVDRQAAEHTWEYAILYDFRQMQKAPTSADLQTAVDYVQVVGGNRRRGPVGVILPTPTPPEMLQKSLVYAQMTEGLVNFEVLLTEEHVERWISEYTRGSSGQTGSAP